MRVWAMSPGKGKKSKGPVDDDFGCPLSALIEDTKVAPQTQRQRKEEQGADTKVAPKPSGKRKKRARRRAKRGGSRRKGRSRRSKKPKRRKRGRKERQKGERAPSSQQTPGQRKEALRAAGEEAARLAEEEKERRRGKERLKKGEKKARACARGGKRKNPKRKPSERLNSINALKGAELPPDPAIRSLAAPVLKPGPPWTMPKTMGSRGVSDVRENWEVDVEKGGVLNPSNDGRNNNEKAEDNSQESDRTRIRRRQRKGLPQLKSWRYRRSKRLRSDAGDEAAMARGPGTIFGRPCCRGIPRIGATYFPRRKHLQKTAVGRGGRTSPGLLVIAPPAMSPFPFTDARFVIGLEPQTLESIRLLRERKTPHRGPSTRSIDYGWRPTPDNGFQASLAKQPKHVREEFDPRLSHHPGVCRAGPKPQVLLRKKKLCQVRFLLFPRRPSREGHSRSAIPVTLTQSARSPFRVRLSTVLEVKVFKVWDHHRRGPVQGSQRRRPYRGLEWSHRPPVRLLTPNRLGLRVKSLSPKRGQRAALGEKRAPHWKKTFRVEGVWGALTTRGGPDAVMEDHRRALHRFGPRCLVEFLRVSKIPVSAIYPVHKKGIFPASAMLEKAKEFSVLLAFDVEVDKDASHLSKGGASFGQQAPQSRVPPFAPIPGGHFSRRDPSGADVVDGTLRLGTPLCVVPFDPATKKRGIVNLGVVTGIENNPPGKARAWLAPALP
ncbi:eukaryotic translation initiation factor 5B, partial [Massospora cicadina]